MMRFSCVQWMRKDMVDQLLRRGRLTDIHMLNFYNTQVENEMAARVAGAAAGAATTTTTATATVAPSTVEPKAEALLSLDEELAQLGQQEKREVFRAFASQLSSVRAAAQSQGPTSWMAGVYGQREWSTSHLSHRSVTAHFAAADNQQQVVLSGHTNAAGGGLASDALPESVQVMVRVPPLTKSTAAGLSTAETAVRSATPEFLAVSVKLNQGGDKVRAKRVSGLLELHFNGAVGDVLVENVATKNQKGEPLATVYKNPAQIAARQHVLTAAAYAGLLAKIEEVTALHVTTTSRYDALLVRDKAVQMRLSQLACFRYGVESLTSFVLGDDELDADDTAYLRKKVLLDSFINADSRADAASGSATAASKETGSDEKAGTVPQETKEGEEIRLNYLDIVKNERQNLYQLPLLESVVLNIYAENALMDAMDCAWHIVRGCPLNEKVAHKSRPEKLIDYPYLDSILETSKYSIASADGSMELQALEYLSPLLCRGASGGSGRGAGVSAVVGALQELVGLTSAGRLRLTAPHVNLCVAAATVEKDLHSLLSFIEKEQLSSGGATADPTFVFCVANYLAEVFTNVAVLYRCTAALTADEEGLGHREWLLAQCFTDASKARRHRYLTDYQLMRAAAKAVGAEESYATHPVELMNAAPRRKAESASDGDGEGDTAKTGKAKASRTA